MIAGPYENKGSDERLAAYKKTLKSHGIVIDEKRIIHTATFERGYPEYAKKLLDLNPDLDAIVCASDNLAFDAYQVLKERGIRIGEDVQVVGFDGSKSSAKDIIKISTIRQPVELIAEESVKALVNIIENNKVEKEIILPISFINGYTTKR